MLLFVLASGLLVVAGAAAGRVAAVTVVATSGWVAIAVVDVLGALVVLVVLRVLVLGVGVVAASGTDRVAIGGVAFVLGVFVLLVVLFVVFVLLVAFLVILILLITYGLGVKRAATAGCRPASSVRRLLQRVCQFHVGIRTYIHPPFPCEKKIEGAS